MNDVAKVLIQNGADLNAVDGGKYTPLYYAAKEGNQDNTSTLQYCNH